MSENTEDKQQEAQHDTWTKYGKLLNSSSPLVIVLLSSSVLTYIKDATIWHWLLFFITGIVLSIIQYLNEIRIQYSELDASRDLHDKLEPIDSKAQSQIYEGLLSMSLIDCTDPELDDVERLMRCRINDLAIYALTPSVYQNHHSRDIAEGGADDYLEKKKKIVMNKFAQHYAEFRKHVVKRLPKGMTFEQAVDSFICLWVKDEVVPAIKDSCKKKIDYYTKLITVSYISRKFKSDVMEWRKKNIDYISKLDVLENRSDIILRSTTMNMPTPEVPKTEGKI